MKNEADEANETSNNESKQSERAIKLVNGIMKKRRAILDIDALWRKKFESQSKNESESGETTTNNDTTTTTTPSGSNGDSRTIDKLSSEPSTSDKKQDIEGIEKKKKKEDDDDEGKGSETTNIIEKTPKKEEIEEEEVRKKITLIIPKGIKSSTRIEAKKTEKVKVEENKQVITGRVTRKQQMELDKNNKKATSSSTLQHTPKDEDQEEMETLQPSSSANGTPNDTNRGYDFPSHEYRSTATPSNYQLYTNDNTNYAAYYQYSANIQSSPQDSSYMVVANQPAAPQSPQSLDDGEANGIAHSTRASPATIQWLLENFETHETNSLPRCIVYDHYKVHCAEHRLDPVNAASFGKLIRSVFLGLKTRRLGTRGNSKYHYYGIKIRDLSLLDKDKGPRSNHNTYYLTDPYSDTVNTVATPRDISMKRKRKASSSSSCRDSVSPAMMIPRPTVTVIPAAQSLSITQTSSHLNSTSPAQNNGVQQQEMYNAHLTSADRASLGDVHMKLIVFQQTEECDEELKKLSLSNSALDNFVTLYYQLCKDVLDSVKKLKFERVEDYWFNFWSGNNGSITKDELLQLSTIEKVQDYIILNDLELYQNIVDCLIPSVLMSQLSAGLTQSCRTFAKNIDIYLKKALNSISLPEVLIKKKMQAIKYMQQGLKRYTSLNHLAQAAKAVLQKKEQVEQMFQDYTKVDMNQVHEQAGWICGCDTLVVQHVNSAFKQNLQRMAPMEDWSEWLESIVDQVLAKYHNQSPESVITIAKQFLLNWSFYTSSIIRDLTLRSATSFGSFHLIRLLADDYMYYLIESKIAKATNQQIITVIRTEKDYPLFGKTTEYEYIQSVVVDLDTKPSFDDDINKL